jgi:hypothetical protein
MGTICRNRSTRVSLSAPQASHGLAGRNTKRGGLGDNQQAYEDRFIGMLARASARPQRSEESQAHGCVRPATEGVQTHLGCAGNKRLVATAADNRRALPTSRKKGLRISADPPVFPGMGEKGNAVVR